MGTDVGDRVKRIRDAKGLSLRDLARETGVSAPMLSQVERGETSPTLHVATKIAVGLGLTLSQLLRLDEDPHVVVVRRSERRTVKREGHRFDELTPSLPGQPHTVTVHTLRAGGVTGGASDPPLHEPGSRETAVVSSGTVVLTHGDETYELAEGDAVTFDADLPHRFENRSKKEATFIAIVTTGLRRA
jgi:XRE family transcriptional regulator, regulator of sulfur utilization